MTPPQSIAHYRILSKIGEGGMGAVYRDGVEFRGRAAVSGVLNPGRVTTTCAVSNAQLGPDGA